MVTERCPRVLPLLIGLLAIGAVAAGGQGADLPPGDGPPPTAFDRIADAGVADDHDGADDIIVYDHTVSRVLESGVNYLENYILYKVLTPAGCRDRSVLRWWYEPWSTCLEVLEVNVIRGEERIPVVLVPARSADDVLEDIPAAHGIGGEIGSEESDIDPEVKGAGRTAASDDVLV